MSAGHNSDAQSPPSVRALRAVHASVDALLVQSLQTALSMQWQRRRRLQSHAVYQQLLTWCQRLVSESDAEAAAYARAEQERLAAASTAASVALAKRAERRSRVPAQAQPAGVTALTRATTAAAQIAADDVNATTIPQSAAAQPQRRQRAVADYATATSRQHADEFTASQSQQQSAASAPAGALPVAAAVPRRAAAGVRTEDVDVRRVPGRRQYAASRARDTIGSPSAPDDGEQEASMLSSAQQQQQTQPTTYANADLRSLRAMASHLRHQLGDDDASTHHDAAHELAALSSPHASAVAAGGATTAAEAEPSGLFGVPKRFDKAQRLAPYMSSTSVTKAKAKTKPTALISKQSAPSNVASAKQTALLIDDKAARAASVKKRAQPNTVASSPSSSTSESAALDLATILSRARAAVALDADDGTGPEFAIATQRATSVGVRPPAQRHMGVDAILARARTAQIADAQQQFALPSSSVPYSSPSPTEGRHAPVRHATTTTPSPHVAQRASHTPVQHFTASPFMTSSARKRAANDAPRPPPPPPPAPPALSAPPQTANNDAPHLGHPSFRFPASFVALRHTYQRLAAEIRGREATSTATAAAAESAFMSAVAVMRPAERKTSKATSSAATTNAHAAASSYASSALDIISTCPLLPLHCTATTDHIGMLASIADPSVAVSSASNHFASAASGSSAVTTTSAADCDFTYPLSRSALTAVSKRLHNARVTRAQSVRRSTSGLQPTDTEILRAATKMLRTFESNKGNAVSYRILRALEASIATTLRDVLEHIASPETPDAAAAALSEWDASSLPTSTLLSVLRVAYSLLSAGGKNGPRDQYDHPRKSRLTFLAATDARSQRRRATTDADEQHNDDEQLPLRGLASNFRALTLSSADDDAVDDVVAKDHDTFRDDDNDDALDPSASPHTVHEEEAAVDADAQTTTTDEDDEWDSDGDPRADES